MSWVEQVTYTVNFVLMITTNFIPSPIIEHDQLALKSKNWTLPNWHVLIEIQNLQQKSFSQKQLRKQQR